MKLNNTHISYCTNIHAGASWADHFAQLQSYLPTIKGAVSPDAAFGLGLRLSAEACADLAEPENLAAFQAWLAEQDVYIFTLNGFPFGVFHLKRVKDDVHFPDWTTALRKDYTIALFKLLHQLTPDQPEAGISTSPLSYRFWFEEGTAAWDTMLATCTQQLVEVADFLHQQEEETGKYLHLDIEPEPDGVLENGEEFLSWYRDHLLPKAIIHFQEVYALDAERAKEIVNRYICICYDVCHIALGYEDHEELMNALAADGIRIGKFQISSALKVELSDSKEERLRKQAVLAEFDEPIYLHQVIAKTADGSLKRYRDLPDALPSITDPSHVEWRSHFHVPIFLSSYGEVDSTQDDILKVIALHKEKQRTNHIEVETYTWGVLPQSLQLPIQDSISRELNWLLDVLKR